jgi:hypothetical protein
MVWANIIPRRHPHPDLADRRRPGRGRLSVWPGRCCPSRAWVRSDLRRTRAYSANTTAARGSLRRQPSSA